MLFRTERSTTQGNLALRNHLLVHIALKSPIICNILYKKVTFLASFQENSPVSIFITSSFHHPNYPNPILNLPIFPFIFQIFFPVRQGAWPGPSRPAAGGRSTGRPPRRWPVPGCRRCHRPGDAAWRPWEFHGEKLENHGKHMGNTWETHGKNHGKIMGKTWENHGKHMGKTWEKHGKKSWEK